MCSEALDTSKKQNKPWVISSDIYLSDWSTRLKQYLYLSPQLKVFPAIGWRGVLCLNRELNFGTEHVVWASLYNESWVFRSEKDKPVAGDAGGVRWRERRQTLSNFHVHLFWMLYFLGGISANVFTKITIENPEVQNDKLYHLVVQSGTTRNNDS